MAIHMKRCSKDDALEMIAQLVPTIAAAALDTNSWSSLEASSLFARACLFVGAFKRTFIAAAAITIIVDALLVIVAAVSALAVLS